MEPQGLRAGHLVALLGAVVVLGALWLPWYELRLGPLERDALTQGAGQLGAPFAALVDGVAAQLDGFGVTAWQAFEGQDVIFAVGAAVVMLVLLAATGVVDGVGVDPAAAGRLASAAGVVLGLFAAFRLLARPGPAELFALGAGPWVALAGAALMAVGGALAVRRPARPMGAGPTAVLGYGSTAPAAAAQSLSGSVPPPGARP